MKKLYIWLIVIALVAIPCSCLWIIQRTVCFEMQNIMRNAGNYNIFTGCTIEVETAKIDFSNPEPDPVPVKTKKIGG